MAGLHSNGRHFGVNKIVSFHTWISIRLVKDRLPVIVVRIQLLDSIQIEQFFSISAVGRRAGNSATR